MLWEILSLFSDQREKKKRKIKGNSVDSQHIFCYFLEIDLQRRATSLIKTLT